MPKGGKATQQEATTTFRLEVWKEQVMGQLGPEITSQNKNATGPPDWTDAPKTLQGQGKNMWVSPSLPLSLAPQPNPSGGKPPDREPRKGSL